MRVLWITAVVVLIDQLTKVIVVRTMYLGQSIPVIGDWLRLTFTENPGMAFGITFGPRSLVTFLSLAATTLIIGYLISVRKTPFAYRGSLALILGGALGNIIDRVFYGVIYGYDGLFVGRVVDFIHVNLWRGYVPEGVPIFGGSYVALFPIWNVADMAIVGGIVGVLICQQLYSRALEKQDELEGTSPPTDAAVLPVTEAGSATPDAAPTSAVSATDEEIPR